MILFLGAGAGAAVRRRAGSACHGVAGERYPRPRQPAPVTGQPAPQVPLKGPHVEHERAGRRVATFTRQGAKVEGEGVWAVHSDGRPQRRPYIHPGESVSHKGPVEGVENAARSEVGGIHSVLAGWHRAGEVHAAADRVPSAKGRAEAHAHTRAVEALAVVRVPAIAGCIPTRHAPQQREASRAEAHRNA